MSGLSQWREAQARAVAEMERELEEAGVIAYEADEGRVTLIMPTGKSIVIERYAYPEASWMELNGYHL